MMVKLELGFIYLVLGLALSFSIGVAVSATISFLISIFKIFKYKTAWFSALTFLITALIGAKLAFDVLTLVGNLGDHTNYKMQTVFIATTIIPGLFTWIYPIILMAMGSPQLIKTDTYKSYRFIWGLTVYFYCYFTGAFTVLDYLIFKLGIDWAVASLLFYPLTIIIAPIYMVISDGIWLPLILHFGGALIGGLLLDD